MSSFITSITETVRYRGREGQLLWLGHRLAGLGTLLFLTVHILETSTVYFLPRLYPEAIRLYRSTPFMLGEILLVIAVLYHGVNGLLVQPRDADALSASILTLLENPDLARAMGEAAHQRIANTFTVEKMVDQTEDIYMRTFT